MIRTSPPTMRTTTDTSSTSTTSADSTTIERYTRRTRWFHAFVYATVLILLATGWWLLAGREGEPSPASRLTGVDDTDLHKWIGYALAAGSIAAVAIGFRGARTFVVETLRFRRGDARWFARWPAAAVTGRFERHAGHFDPGQRIANVVIIVGLIALVASGIGLALVHGGTAFVWFVRIHKWATYIVTPVLLGHILIAAGILPGYRRVWRSMHLGGRLDVDVARRLWPEWLARRRDPES
jgi:cytochrome b subunit of formate dehydrogenase